MKIFRMMRAGRLTRIKVVSLAEGDWRRQSVNTLIQRLYKEIKGKKNHVKFGLSPFGIWKPGYPESIEGFSQYDQLYADARLWLNKGWIDYFTPQLYWDINRIPQSFPVLLGWWASENLMNRHLWPGISVYKGGGEKNNDETVNQIMISRAMLPKSMGTVHWSITALIKNDSLSKALLNGPYKKPALVPASPWLDNKAPASPVTETAIVGDSLNISWSHSDEKDVFRWVVYYKYGTQWDYTILNSTERSIKLQRSLLLMPTAVQKEAGNTSSTRITLNGIAVTAVDRTGNESIPFRLDF